MDLEELLNDSEDEAGRFVDGPHLNPQDPKSRVRTFVRLCGVCSMDPCLVYDI